jgi:hypothetical protein
MKKMLSVTNDAYLAARTSVVLVVVLALGLGFWTATTPIAQAQEMSATEMIESKLPHGKTMLTCSKAEFLAGVCAAVKKWPNAAPQIVRGANAKREWARDIVATALRCLPPDHKGHVCDGVAAIVNAAVSAAPDDASGIIEMVIRQYPECKGAIGHGEGHPGYGDGGRFTQPPPNVNPPPGSIGGGASQVAQCTICHVPPGNPNNPQTLTIGCPAADAHLRNHPLDYAGQCQVTPPQNR